MLTYSAMFLAQLLLDAAPDTGKVLTLTVRYYINDVPVENFAPQQRLETGAHAEKQASYRWKYLKTREPSHTWNCPKR